MTVHGKPKTRLPTLPTALVNPATAARFTHSHRSATNPLSFTGYKAKPSPETLNLGWAETKCRSGPISVAKGRAVVHEAIRSDLLSGEVCRHVDGHGLKPECFRS